MQDNVINCNMRAEPTDLFSHSEMGTTLDNIKKFNDNNFKKSNLVAMQVGGIGP